MQFRGQYTRGASFAMVLVEVVAVGVGCESKQTPSAADSTALAALNISFLMMLFVGALASIEVGSAGFQAFAKGVVASFVP